MWLGDKEHGGGVWAPRRLDDAAVQLVVYDAAELVAHLGVDGDGAACEAGFRVGLEVAFNAAGWEGLVRL